MRTLWGEFGKACREPVRTRRQGHQGCRQPQTRGAAERGKWPDTEGRPGALATSAGTRVVWIQADSWLEMDLLGGSWEEILPNPRRSFFDILPMACPHAEPTQKATIKEASRHDAETPAFCGRRGVLVLCCRCRSSVTKSCLTLCSPVDHSSPGSSVLHHLQESLTFASIESQTQLLTKGSLLLSLYSG